LIDLSPRRAGVLIAAGMSAVVLSACGSSEPSKPAAAQPAAPAGQAAPTKGKLLGTFQTSTTSVSSTGRK
jgi:hypothetical protein